MATCDPKTLLNDGSCFLCLSEKELNVAVAQLLCDIASGGVPCACENLGGADSPLNNTTPDFIGQVYVQDGGVVWQAGSLLSSSWTVLCDPTGGCNGMIWGPDATELDSFTWSNGTFPDSNNFDTQPITTLSFPSLATVPGIFDFSSDSELVSVSVPLLTTAGTILANSCSSLTSVDFSSLTQVDSQFDIDGCSLLTALSLPMIQSATIDCSGCTVLTDLNLPVYQTGDLLCYSCSLASLSLPGYTTGNLTCGDNPIPSISLAGFTGPGFDCSFCILSSLSLPVFGTSATNSNFNVSSTNLTSISLPLLAEFDSFIAADCASLTSISAPNMSGITSAPGSTITASGCALDIATMNFLLHVAAIANWGVGYFVILDGGTNAGLASLSIQGQADYATLVGNGATVTINP